MARPGRPPDPTALAGAPPRRWGRQRPDGLRAPGSGARPLRRPARGQPRPAGRGGFITLTSDSARQAATTSRLPQQTAKRPGRRCPPTLQSASPARREPACACAACQRSLRLRSARPRPPPPRPPRGRLPGAGRLPGRCCALPARPPPHAGAWARGGAGSEGGGSAGPALSLAAAASSGGQYVQENGRIWA